MSSTCVSARREWKELVSDPNFFQSEPVKVAERSLPCSKNKHDNCGDQSCECQCHQYMIWHPQESRWKYA
jgi:hypothetical protein